jgi:PAS domain S-box-containing protein
LFGFGFFNITFIGFRLKITPTKPFCSQVRVKTRPNPLIDFGRIDSSCALVLCAANTPDMPIVYCSEPFEVLTGYSSAEIMGRNCRFLQSPDGNVKQGVKREHTDDRTVWELKEKLAKREEVQTSIVNYKKGGERFENILTTVPICWDSQEVRYIVGFQVDRKACFL